MPTYSRLQKPVLVLNASYEPINICAARRALVLVLKGIASAEEAISTRCPFGAPHRARAFCDPPARIPPHPAPDPRPFAQEHSDARPLHLPVLPRSLPSGELTLDHVIPRSRAGESAWENLVACCHPCNNRKGSRTPEEAGMKLARAAAAVQPAHQPASDASAGQGRRPVAEVPVLLTICRPGDLAPPGSSIA